MLLRGTFECQSGRDAKEYFSAMLPAAVCATCLSELVGSQQPTNNPRNTHQATHPPTYPRMQYHHALLLSTGVRSTWASFPASPSSNSEPCFCDVAPSSPEPWLRDSRLTSCVEVQPFSEIPGPKFPAPRQRMALPGWVSRACFAGLDLGFSGCPRMEIPFSWPRELGA